MLPVWDGSHLDHLPGLSAAFDPHPHQLNAVWRIMGTDGNVLLGHRVGAGKTAAMVIAGQQLRRTGQISKPLYVVPNHMLEQFAAEMTQLYPMAKVLVAGKEDLQAEQRRAFAARCATDTWDAVVMTHERLAYSRCWHPRTSTVRRSPWLIMATARRRRARPRHIGMSFADPNGGATVTTLRPGPHGAMPSTIGLTSRLPAVDRLVGMNDFERFRKQRTIVLTTFKRDGTAVPTPVSIAVDNDPTSGFVRTWKYRGKGQTVATRSPRRDRTVDDAGTEDRS